MSKQTYHLSDFDYDLPESLIAQEPAEPRDHARLLVYNRSDQSITDDVFHRLPDYLPGGSVLTLNNSRVEKARLLFGKREIFITRVIDPYTVEALVRPGKIFKTGRSISLTETNVQAEVLSVTDDGQRTIRLNVPIDSTQLDSHRHTPFPPYIRPDEKLAERYQTIFARDDGSKAAPTAGLHFTDRVFDALSGKSIDIAEITLHVGLGTFAPVKTNRLDEHIMHSEWYRISGDAAGRLRSAERIIAVGTTSARVLESVASESAGKAPLQGTGSHQRFRNFAATEGETDIFITPGYRFQAVDALITNFHLPKSTLLMMISAFVGVDEMHRIYSHAIRQKYRFYSFGDAMLLL
ncbi:tRNA preQ1(34) S-adenosylmethionine ribosyltransferase-isomerase QueA [Balneolales bacterium ANBcel1]|nr:tRNA preQ1(34) S-adenosylmethionine ribosyltransferase-isomerase QueA [Balneolales bacterium ANBcel1]